MFKTLIFFVKFNMEIFILNLVKKCKVLNQRKIFCRFKEVDPKIFAIRDPLLQKVSSWFNLEGLCLNNILVRVDYITMHCVCHN